MSIFQFRNLSHGGRIMFRIVFDFLSIILVASGVFAIKYGAEPNHRGFFCDDETIRHPVLSDTIPMSLAISVGILLPLVVIIVLEFSQRNNTPSIISDSQYHARNPSWIGSIYNTSAVFLFGMAASQFLTEAGKFSVGRLRPHFLTLCNPDMTKLNCSMGYITANVCTSTDTFKMRDARLSFPSGHSSFSMYCMMYLILYIQARLSCDAIIFLKPLTQLVFLSMGVFTCLSRVSDYKHHWSDVFAGAALGVSVSLFAALFLADFGHNLRTSRTVNGAEYESLVRTGGQSGGGSVSSYYSKIPSSSSPSGSGV